MARAPVLSGRSRGALLAAAGLLLLSCAGCGRKGDPTAPGLTLPSPPPQVSLSGVGGQLTVSWTEPREDLAGRPLRPGFTYRVLRASWPPGESPCEGCPEDLAVAAEVDPVARESQGLPRRAWADPEAEVGRTYQYRVQTMDPRGRPGPPSAPVRIAWFLPAPPALAVGEGDGELAVSADEPSLPAGWEAEGLQVYEGSGTRPAPTEPRGREATVVGLPNGIAWEGVARWRARSPEGWLVEGTGTRVSGTPRDAVPPLPPEDLVAVAGPEGVLLHWMPSGQEAYAAVLVFRTAPGEEPRALARLEGKAVSFTDPEAGAGESYRYHVVAEDAAGNRSIPSRETSLRIPRSSGGRPR